MLPCFIETNDDIIWFAINKINDEYLCFPRYINEYKGEKYSEWFVNSSIKIEKYFKNVDGLGEKAYLIPENKILKFYDPTSITLNLKEQKFFYDFFDSVNTIVNYISDYFQIDKKYIGIEGSLLLGKYNKLSDIDILVYGIDNARKIQKNFFNISNNKFNIRLFSKDESINYVEKRINCGYGSDLNISLKQFRRRFYGFVNDKQFSVVCVPIMNQDGYIDLNRQLKTNSIYDGILTITNDDYSSIIPAIYYGVDSNGNQYKIEIFNHYGINQAKVGEKIYIKGKLYIDVKTKEKIIILSFWSKIKERFDLYE